jgi:hypothetical protein
MKEIKLIRVVEVLMYSYLHLNKINVKWQQHHDWSKTRVSQSQFVIDGWIAKLINTLILLNFSRKRTA